MGTLWCVISSLTLSTCVGPQISPLQMWCTLENTVCNAFQETYGLQVHSGSGSILREEKNKRLNHIQHRPVSRV